MKLDNDMNQFIFDIEGDSLNPTKIWCLAANTKLGVKSTTSYDKMKEKLENADIVIGHNIYRFDVPVLERILGIKIRAKIVDTLALSWYLYPQRIRHGLEEWGEDLGVKKPEIIRWDDPELIDEYRHRCEEDVKINTKLWNKMWKYLMRLYGTEEEVWRFIDYLMFKMDCAREQERSRWKLDIDLCKKSLDELTAKKEDAVADLIAAMPKVAKMEKKTRPAKPFKQDGTYSVVGAKWFKLLRDHNLPADYDGVVEVVREYVDGNPNSHVQIKDWLYSNGWKPETFKYDKDDEGNLRKIPQVNLEHGGGICPSVSKLYDRCPELARIEGLGVISHRISILNGFMESVDDEGYVQAQIAGLTNTLRFKHKTVVNLPGVDKPYGEIIRGVLIAPEGYELCGSDKSSLEDRLKQHYIFPYDPDYVREMQHEDYDPHLSLALLAGEVTQKQVDDYISGKDKSIKKIRHTFKQGNYACQYGAGPPRLALTADISVKEAEKVHKTYWEKNWAIKEVAKHQEIVTISGQMWLKNPINGFFYSLRSEKDIFSTLVQGSASYVFDRWVQIFRQKRSQLTAQFHDEVVLCLRKGNREKAIQLLRGAIKELNEELQLNRELDIDIQFGDRYSDIH